MSLPKGYKENVSSKRIHKKSASRQSGVRLIIIAVGFLVFGIISFTAFYSFRDIPVLTGLAAVGVGLFFVANIIFIISMFRKINGDKKIMSKKKLLGIMFVGFIVFIVTPDTAYDEVYSVYYPEQYAEREEERKQKESEERQQRYEVTKFEREQRQIQAEKEQKQKELDEYESIVTESGRLKYRPYWMVGDKNDEMEMNGEIIKSKECADLVTKIAEVGAASPLQEVYHKQWVETCIRFR